MSVVDDAGAVFERLRRHVLLDVVNKILVILAVAKEYVYGRGLRQ
jgi:hypothetical protein